MSDCLAALHCIALRIALHPPKQTEHADQVLLARQSSSKLAKALMIPDQLMPSLPS